MKLPPRFVGDRAREPVGQQRKYYHSPGIGANLSDVLGCDNILPLFAILAQELVQIIHGLQKPGLKTRYLKIPYDIDNRSTSMSTDENLVH